MISRDVRTFMESDMIQLRPIPAAGIFMFELGRQRGTQGLESFAERTGLAGGNDQLMSSSG